MTATLKTVSPDGEAVVGLFLGIWNGTGCSVVVANDRAIVSHDHPRDRHGDRHAVRADL